MQSTRSSTVGPLELSPGDTLHFCFVVQKSDHSTCDTRQHNKLTVVPFTDQILSNTPDEVNSFMMEAVIL